MKTRRRSRYGLWTVANAKEISIDATLTIAVSELDGILNRRTTTATILLLLLFIWVQSTIK